MSDTLGSSPTRRRDAGSAEPTSDEAPRSRRRDNTTTTRSRRRTAARPPVFFVVLVILALLKAWLMRGLTLGAWNPVDALAFETAFVVLLLGLVDVVPPRRWYWLDLVAYCLLSALMFAITVYVHFYAQLFDPKMMAMAGQVGTVADDVAQLIKPAYYLLLADIPLLALWVVFLYQAAARQRRRLDALAAKGRSGTPRRIMVPLNRNWKVAALAGAALLVVIAQIASVLNVPSYVDGLAIAKSRGLVVAQAAVFLPHPSENSAADDTSDNDVVAPGEHVASTPDTVAPTPVVALTPAGKFEAKIERVRGALNGSRVTTFPAGAFRGKNVIIVQVEALNTMLLQKEIDGKEITPNLNRLIGECWYFPNTYSQTGIGNTADAEFIVNSSLLAPRAQAASVAYVDRKVPGLPRLLNASGYDTFTMHTNRVWYWNRKELYAALGFKHYYDKLDFPPRDVISMGPSDEVLFRKAIDVINQKEAGGKPFYGQFITLSAHAPFTAIPESRRPVRTPSKYRGSTMGRYISAESYGDLAIGQFVDALKKSDAWKDSIVIFYGDHTAMDGNDLDGADAKAARALLGRNYGPADRQRIPLIIHLPGQTESETSTDTVGQVDIMPTVADLLGLDISQLPHMGRSVFVRSNGFALLNAYLPGGSFVNDRVVFMPGLGFDDGTAVNIADNTSARATDIESNDYKRMLVLTRLCSKWVDGLPKRKDVGSLGNAWIPDTTARDAAGQGQQ